MGRQRADAALVARGLVESRARAQALIMAGSVFLGENRTDRMVQIALHKMRQPRPNR